MSDDEWSKEAGRAMSEADRAFSAELDAYASGALSPEALAALEARAAQDPELAEALALFRPLDAQLLERIAGEALPAKVIRPPAWRRGAVALLAAAAAVLLGVFGLSEQAAPLPEYSLKARTQDARWRGGEERLPDVRSDSQVELILAPAQPVEGAVEGRLFVWVDGQAHLSPEVAEVSPDGAVRIRGPAERVLGVNTGTVTAVLLVGRPEELPTVAPERSSPSDPYRTGRARIVVRPR